jgi:hypothetical protein
MQINRAEIDAVLDAQGRFVWTPNALTQEGQRNEACDLQPGESLQDFLVRHVPGVDSGAWVVSIGGAVVPRAMWAKTFPKHGMHIACRATVGKQVVSLVAIAALAYFTFGFGAATAGMWGAGAVAGAWGGAAALGVYVAGSILINKVLAPKVPKIGDMGAARQVYSLTSQRNTPRAYEALPTLWGEMRVTPDLAGHPYAWYESDDQYMSVILLGGVNVHSAADLSIGDTPIGNYDDVQVYYDGFPGMASQKVPLFSNTDSLAGGQLDVVDPAAQLSWTTRTSSVDTVRLAVDFEYTLWFQGNQGIRYNEAFLYLEYRRVGTSQWTAHPVQRLKSSSTSARRRTLSIAVPQGQYEVRMAGRKIPKDGSNLGGTRDIMWTTLRSVQPDTTDYSQWGRIAVRIKATGQISGSLDTLRATYRAKPMPIWNGAQWVTATTRANGLSNPGAIILQTLRGVRDKAGRLQFGYGLTDEQIDIEGLKAFMLHCTAKGYTYDRWVADQISLGDFCDEVALAGMGQFSWTDGSRPTVVFVGAGQPLGGVVNMANMLKASFSVDYALSNVSDGIEYQYVDRDKGYETQTLRVTAPGVTTMLNPARVTGEGVTTEAHAAVMARYHLAQSLYQYKTIGYTADIECLDYRRLSVLSISHDLTQWGFGGRLVGVQLLAGGQIRVQLDEPVPALNTPHLGLRVPGERDYRVWQVVPFVGESDVLTLVGEWPEGVDLPGDGADNPAHDTLWCYDFKATPGYRVRVVSMEPDADLKGARVSCVPEGPEFWDYVLNGTYVPAPSASALPQLARPAVHNLRVIEQVNVQGNTQWYALNVTWDVEGAADHCQVWAGPDGSELTLVDAQALGNRSSFRIEEPGQWLVQVRPFDSAGRAGDASTVLYVTAGVAVPPPGASAFLVQALAGGLRRFAWSFAAGLPAAYAGVQIRYAAGDVPVAVADWDVLTPLGDANDVYVSQFETTRPLAGLWTFALRVIDTAGMLSSTLQRFAIELGESFEQVQQPDLTPPPAPSDVQVNSALASVIAQWAMPDYTVGHGHRFTRIYAAPITAAQPDPARSQASVVSESGGPVASFAASLGSTWRLWLVHVSNDGVESQDAGPFAVVVGKVGDADLADDLDLAAKLADGSISGAKLADQALDATKFAAGIEPVTIWTGAALPTTRRTNSLSWNGKLYTWDGSQYALPPAGELADGAVTASKIAVGAVDASKVAAGVELVKIWQGASLPTTHQGAVLTWGGKLYRWSGSAYTAAVAAADVAGQIVGTQISDNAITTPKLAAGAVNADKVAANAITSAKIAAGAVTADQLAANSVTASKMVITDLTNLVPDPELQDAAAWELYTGWSVVPASSALGFKSTGALVFSGAPGAAGTARSKRFTVEGGASYYVERQSSAALSLVRVYWEDGAGGYLSFAALSAATGLVSGTVTAPANAKRGYLYFATTAGAPNSVGGLIVRRRSGGELIVDGAITADKVAANSITATKLMLSDTSNAYPDYDCADPAAYTSTTAYAIVNASTAYGAKRVIRIAETAAVSSDATVWSFADLGIQLEPNSEYLVSLQMASIGSTGAVTLQALTRLGLSSGTAINWGAETVALSLTDAAARGAAYREFTLSTGSNSRLALGFRVLQGAVTGGYFGSVTIRKKAAASLIVDGAVTALKIAANAVTADAIAANAITAAKIAAGAISAREIAAGAITTEKLLVTSTSSVSIDPFFQDAGYWEGGGVLVKPLADNPYGANVLYTSSVVSNYLPPGALFPIDPTKTYRFEVAIRAVAATTTRAFALVRFYTIDGAPIQSTGSTGWNGTNSANHYFPGSGTTATTGWVLHSLAAGPDGAASIPANAAYCKLGMFFNYGAGTAVETQVGKLQVTAMSGATMIVDGAITATKLAANSIAVGTAAIQNGAIVNAHIGNLSADKITAGVLAAARIAAGSITASHLATNSVTTDKIAANAVTANELAAAAVTAAKIASKTITAAQIAAGAVTATEISVASLSAIAANLGTVTAGRIQNAANTSYWNLNATGSARMLQLGSDLSYDETNGLRINKLNVIEVAQLAPGSVSQSQTFTGGPATIWRNTGWNTILSFNLAAGKAAILSGFGDYLFDSADAYVTFTNSRAYEADIQVVVGGAVAMVVPLSPTGPPEGTNRPRLFFIPGCVANGSLTSVTEIQVQVRSVVVSPSSVDRRRVNSLTLNALIINR